MKRIVATTATRALAIGAALVVTTACSSQRATDGYSESEYRPNQDSFLGEYGEFGNLDVTNGWVKGNIGPVRGVDSSASGTGYQESGYAVVEVISTSARGSTMHVLDFEGGFDHPAMKPGNVLVFDQSRPDDYGAMFVTSLNCSSESNPGEWEYDADASEVTIEPRETEDPDVLQVDYSTTATDGFFGEDVSSGTFYVNTADEEQIDEEDI